MSGEVSLVELSVVERSESSLSPPLVLIPAHELVAMVVAAVEGAVRRGHLAVAPPPAPATVPLDLGMDLEQTFTTEEVARNLRCTPSTATAYCRSGALKAARVGRRWVVSRSSLDAFKARTVVAAEPSNEQPDAVAARVLARIGKRRP